MFHCGVFLVSLFLTLTLADACILPTEMHDSSWVYQSSTLTVQGNDTLNGVNLQTRGTNLQSYKCCFSNSDVVVLKSVDSYSDRGNDRYIYLCMKFTYISSNIIKFYLLADLSTETVPSERVYLPAYDASLPSVTETCKFCSYTNPPPDNDVRTLQRSGTNELMFNTNSQFCPCEVKCNTACNLGAFEIWKVISLVTVFIFAWFDST